MKLQKYSIKMIAVGMGLLLNLSANAADFVPSEVLVKYREGEVRTKSTMKSLYDSVKVKKVRYFSSRAKNLEHLILSADMDVKDAVRALESDPRVEYAQPNYIYRTPEVMAAAPAETCKRVAIPGCEGEGCLLSSFFSAIGGCNSAAGDRPDILPAPDAVDPPVEDPDLAKLWGVEKIGAPNAWKETRGSKDILVAVVDTGIDYNHPDLAFNMYRSEEKDAKDPVGFDFVHKDGLPYDDNMHGTHVAGTIGATGGNGVAISGVSQVVSLLAVKVLSAEGSATAADLIAGVDYAVDKGVKILNASWGMPAFFGQKDKALSDCITRTETAGVLFVAAAGNGDPFTGASWDNDNSFLTFLPAAFENDNVMAVAAIDKNDDLAPFSNYGATSVDVAAPGVKIYSTLPGGKYGDTIKDKEGNDRDISGTSMAAPHAVGAAALIWAANPTWNYKQVKQRLIDTVDKISGLEGKMVSGGRINVAGALRSTE